MDYQTIDFKNHCNRCGLYPKPYFQCTNCPTKLCLECYVYLKDMFPCERHILYWMCWKCCEEERIFNKINIWLTLYGVNKSCHEHSTNMCYHQACRFARLT